jgi:hypothetical protein
MFYSKSYFSFLAKYCWDEKIKEDWMGRACRTRGNRIKPINYLAGKLSVSRSLRRPRLSWDDGSESNMMGSCGLDSSASE